jgi:hypothetical protein
VEAWRPSRRHFWEPLGPHPAAHPIPSNMFQMARLPCSSVFNLRILIRTYKRAFATVVGQTEECDALRKAGRGGGHVRQSLCKPCMLLAVSERVGRDAMIDGSVSGRTLVVSMAAGLRSAGYRKSGADPAKLFGDEGLSKFRDFQQQSLQGLERPGLPAPHRSGVPCPARGTGHFPNGRELATTRHAWK